jgi:hypothetical protein
MQNENITPITYTGLDVARRVGLERILNVVCDYTSQTPADVKSRWRKGEVQEARHLYCYLARLSSCNNSLSKIGKFIGRDHATVLHSTRTIKAYLENDKSVMKKVTDLKLMLGRFSNADVENNRITKDHVGFYRSPMQKLDLRIECGKTDVVSKITVN